MMKPLIIFLLSSIAFISCSQKSLTHADNGTNPSKEVQLGLGGKGALLLTCFNSFDELKRTIKIEYSNVATFGYPPLNKKPIVRLTHTTEDGEVTSLLKSGATEFDFSRARDGGLASKVALVINTPYGVLNQKNLVRAYNLLRRRGDVFGEGDIAFYHIAEKMMDQITNYDKALLNPKHLTEKGFMNTFNHFLAQAFLTSIFSEKLADFIADAHERRSMPQLISGEFTEDLIKDIDYGPTDNYVDMINNEWGQEFGKHLKSKYSIYKGTEWTPELLENYLNDIQIYFSWTFQVGFKPFKATDPLIIRFSRKINVVMQRVPPSN